LLALATRISPSFHVKQVTFIQAVFEQFQRVFSSVQVIVGPKGPSLPVISKHSMLDFPLVLLIP
jgi:hypothetical protein